ncbi:autotransporter domain-containing protein [Arenimonas aestuarii]
MYAKGSVATGRQTVDSILRRAWHWAVVISLACLALAWSSAASAQSCDFVAIGPTSQLAPAGSTVSFTLEAQTACAATVNISLVVDVPDNTGGASIVPPANPTITLDTPYTFDVILGPNPGASGTVTATCLSGGCAGNFLTFSFTTNNQFVYTNSTAATVVTNQIQDFTVATSLQINGNAGGLATNYNVLTPPTAYGTRPADTFGIATLTETITAQGTFTVRGSVVCPVTFVLEGCGAVPPVDFTVQVEAVALDAVTPQTVAMTAGDLQTLTVYFGSLTFPGPDGTAVSWALTGEPAGGDGAVTGSLLAAGESDASFTATVPGVYTIEASVACVPCAVNTRTFQVTVAAPLPFSLVATSANPATGTVGVAQTFSVQLDQGGVPIPAGTIEWTAAAAPFGPVTTTSLTDAAGNASVTLTPATAGSFTAALTATYDPDGIPANGDEVSFDFDANIAAVPGLAIASGDGQQADTGQPFAQPLVVLADDSGVPAAGVGITWTVAGDAVVSPGGVTDASGQASATVTAGATAGPVTVTATRQDAPTVSVTFNLTTTALPFNLVATSANPATGTPNTPVAFGVALDQGGTPVAGAAISWSANAPFAPATANTTTDAAGQAGASFTASAAGTFTGAVTARFDPDGVPASGDEISLAFDATITAVPGLVIESGDGQGITTNLPFPAPLVVLADDSGLPAVGVGITWTVAGDASLVASGPTDANGRASATVTAGPTAGPVVVTATRQDAPAVSVAFTLAVDPAGTLALVSGGDQLMRAGQPSDPLVVKLVDAGGLPVAGASITWTSNNGSLDTATSTTGANGETSNFVTPDISGGAEIVATSPLAQAPLVISLKGALSELAGLNATTAEIANAVDSLCPALAALPARNAAQQDLLDRCLELIEAAALDPAATVLALDQLMADLALAQGNAAFAAAQSQFQNLRARIAALRSGTQGTDFGGLALTTPQGLFSLGLLAQAGDGDEPTMEIGTDFSRWGFFASGTLGRGEVEPGQVDPAYDTDIEGVTAGFDYRISDRWILGGAVGMTRQDTRLPDGRGEVETSGWSVSGYTTFYQPDSWYVDGVLTWGRNDYDLLRHIRYTLPLAGGGTQTIDQSAVSSSDGDMLSMAVTFGRDFNRGAWGLGPYGRLLFTRLDFDAIEETLQPGPGSGLGLRIEERELESVASVLGGKLTYTHSASWGVLMPHLQLEWEHEFRDDPQAIEARFLNDPTGTAMRLRGDALDTDYFRIGLGLSMVLTKGRSGFFYYERLMGKDRSSQYNLALGFRMEF